MLTCIFPLLGALKSFPRREGVYLLSFLVAIDPRTDALQEPRESNGEVPSAMAMELAAFLYGASYFFMELGSLRHIPLFYTARNRKRLLFNGRDIYLRISDLPLEENGRMKESALLRMPEDAAAIAAIKRQPYWPRGRQPQIDVDNFLAYVPDSIDGSVRIYLEHGLGPQAFQNYFSRDVTNAARYTYAHPTTRGYNGLSLQWRVPEPNAWFETPSFILSGEDLPGLVINVKKVSTVEHSGGRLICKRVLMGFMLKTAYSLT